MTAHVQGNLDLERPWAGLVLGCWPEPTWWPCQDGLDLCSACTEACPPPAGLYCVLVSDSMWLFDPLSVAADAASAETVGICVHASKTQLCWVQHMGCCHIIGKMLLHKLHIQCNMLIQ